MQLNRSTASSCFEHDHDQRVRQTRDFLRSTGDANADDAATLVELERMMREHPDAVIRLDCFSRREVERVRQQLGPAKLDRVQFTWMIDEPGSL